MLERKNMNLFTENAVYKKKGLGGGKASLA